MGKKRRSLSQSELRSFRHSVSVLKAKGLVSKRVDARKQKPTRYMQSKVSKLTPILEGTAAGVKVSPDLLKQYREAGFPIFNRRVVVHKSPEEIASVRKGHALIRRPLGDAYMTERLILPFSPRNIQEFENRVSENPGAFNSLKYPGDVFAFKIYGNNSRATFDDIQALLEYLNRYQAIHERGDAWASLEFFRVAPGAWKANASRTRTKTEQDRRSTARRRYSLVKGERIHKAEEAERKRIKRATDLSWAEKERARNRARMAEKRAHDPAWNQSQRKKDNARKVMLRKQADYDKRNRDT